MLSTLKKDGIIVAHRGAYGGYKLSDEPQNISVGQVLRCLEDELKIVDCIGECCEKNKTCAPQILYNKLYKHINDYLDGISLKQLSEENDANLS